MFLEIKPEAASDRRKQMDRACFDIAPDSGEWHVIEGDHKAGPYATREAAFEAVVGPISNALKEGSEVTLVIRANPSASAI